MKQVKAGKVKIKDNQGFERVVSGVGVQYIYPDKKKGKWENIKDFISDYRKLYPEEAEMHISDLYVRRMSQKNEFASTDDKSVRWALNLPSNLFMTINKYYPEVFENKKDVHKMMRMFPEFRVAREV